MLGSPESYGWKSIESAPLDEDVSLQVTDSWQAVQSPEPKQAYRGGLGQFGQENTAGGHAGEMEAIPRLAPSPMTPRRFPRALVAQQDAYSRDNEAEARHAKVLTKTRRDGSPLTSRGCRSCRGRVSATELRPPHL
jgi:hypothetical protein